MDLGDPLPSRLWAKGPSAFWSPLYCLLTLRCSLSQSPDREEEHLSHHVSERSLPPQEEKLLERKNFCNTETLLTQGPGADHQAQALQAASHQDAGLHQGR